jgi:hypothetical protein
VIATATDQPVGGVELADTGLFVREFGDGIIGGGRFGERAVDMLLADQATVVLLLGDVAA